MEKNYVDVWNKLHKEFKKNEKNILNYDNWLDDYKDIIDNVKSEIIDLGCGVTGNNTLYLLERGKKVLSCDFAIEALKVIRENILNSKTMQFDMLDGLPFDDNSIELVIADLSLHYFTHEDTKNIISELHRTIKNDGYLLMRVNSTNSSEYRNLLEKNIEPLEKHLYINTGMKKRFFDESDINEYFSKWNIESTEEQNMTRWCNDKIIWKCKIKNIK